MGGVGVLENDDRRIEHLLEEVWLGGSKSGASGLSKGKLDGIESEGHNLLTNSKQDPGNDASLNTIIAILVFWIDPQKVRQTISSGRSRV